MSQCRPTQLPDLKQLIDKINNIFYGSSFCNLSDGDIEALFAAAQQVENVIQFMKTEAPETLETMNAQLYQFENENFPVVYSFNEFELASDRLLQVFFTNKSINDSALSKAVHHYISVFSISRFEKVYIKLIAQCAMSNAVLSIIDDCNTIATLQDNYNATISQELPILVDQGRTGFVAATKLTRTMLLESETSLEALLHALLKFGDNINLQIFVHGTIIKILKKVDQDYIKFWKLICNIKDQSLLPKLADRFPDFLSCLESFIVCCGEGLECTITDDFKLHWDCVNALLTERELVALIKIMVNSEGPSGTCIKEAMAERQLGAFGLVEELDHSLVWPELAKACFN